MHNSEPQPAEGKRKARVFLLRGLEFWRFFYRERWLDAEGEAKPRRTKAARGALLREAERQSMAELREDSTQKELSPEQRSPSRDPSKRSPLTATAATATGGQSGYRSPGPEVCCTLASSRLGRIQRP